jgi:hypothetical protein
MKRNNYCRYFRVFTYDTTVTEVSTNDFNPPRFRPFKKDWLVGNTQKLFGVIAAVPYTLLTGKDAFVGYSSRAKAMEMAKAGALKYIDSLIALGASGHKTLLQYRTDHYEDLCINLLSANIENVSREAAGLVPIIIVKPEPLWF